MAAVRDILARKGNVVVGLPPAASVLDASRLMSERGLGAVMVLEDGRLVGIFTERDVLRRVVAEQRDPAGTPLGAVMTTTVLTCTPSTELAECREVMTSRRIRHLPVMGPDGLCGVISSGDVLAYQVVVQESEIAELNRYVFDVR